jgi:alanyl aminopeptidase
VFDALIGEIASDDAQVRERALKALGQVREPALVGRALDLALDPRLRQNERLIALRPLLEAAETRDAAWAWLTAHFDALTPLLPDRFAGRIPGLVRLCDPRRIEEVRGFFTPRIAQLTGGPRILAQALESAAQCAARVAAQRDSVLGYLDAP